LFTASDNTDRIRVIHVVVDFSPQFFSESPDLDLASKLRDTRQPENWAATQKKAKNAKDFVRYEASYPLPSGLTAFGWLASQGLPPLAQDQGRET